MGGLLILLTIWLISPLFLGSWLLYAVALPARPSGLEWFYFGVAGAGASASLLVVASSGHFRWLLPCWGAGLLAVALLVARREASFGWRAVAVAACLGLLPLLAFRVTSLRTAVAAKDVFWVKVLFALRADANKRDVYMFAQGARSVPVLMAAVEAEQPEVLQLLLEHGADPNARQTERQVYKQDTMQFSTPVLQQAMLNHQPRLVNLLLAAGADPLARDHWGRDALRIARDYDYADSAAVRRAGQRRQHLPGRR